MGTLGLHSRFTGEKCSKINILSTEILKPPRRVPRVLKNVFSDNAIHFIYQESLDAEIGSSPASLWSKDVFRPSIFFSLEDRQIAGVIDKIGASWKDFSNEEQRSSQVSNEIRSRFEFKSLEFV